MKFTLIFLIVFPILILSCEKEKKECNSENISADIQFSKVSDSCSDIDLPWEISFGVSFDIIFDIKCEGDCTEKRVIYKQTKSYVKKQNEIVEFFGTASGGVCNKVRNTSQTLNTKKENDPGLITYEIGDTIVYEFLDPIMCTSDDFGGCSSQEIQVDLQEFVFEYILQPEDFDCD